MINRYEDSRREIFDMLDISPENHKYKYFNPDISRARIGKWKNFNENFCNKKEWYDFCEEISHNLAAYCYNDD